MSIEMFDFKGHEVRVTVDEQGESRWVASDVARALGYRDAANMIRMIDEEDQGYSKVSTSLVSGEISTRQMTVINESGLYTALFRSNLEDVKPFRRWVTDEVLPSIRKHGGYISDGATTEQVEILQRELREKRDALDTAYSREDRTYGMWQEAQRELDSLKLSQEIREEFGGGIVNVYDFIFSRTGDYAFSAEWALQLARDIGRVWPYVFADRDGVFAIENDLRDAWSLYGYDSLFSVHKAKLTL